MAHRLTRVRALANLNGFAYGEERLVDASDPDVKALIDGGWLERLSKGAEVEEHQDTLAGTAGADAATQEPPAVSDTPAVK